MAETKQKSPKRYVGRAMKRVEDPRLIKGIATYVDDVKLPNLLHAEFGREPARPREDQGDQDRCGKEAPGRSRRLHRCGLGCQGGDDPLRSRRSRREVTRPHGPRGRARLFRRPPGPAVVVAETRTMARDAVDLVEVDYEPLPAVTDPEKALEKGSPLTHPEHGTNVAFTWNLPAGDIDGAFKKADKVLKLHIVHPRLTPMAIEPRGCAASWNAGEGRSRSGRRHQSRTSSARFSRG